MINNHYQALLNAIHTTMIESRTNNEADYKTAGLSMKRMRWDLLHFSKIRGEPAMKFVCSELYPYLNDDHIDTALRKITGTK